MIRSGSVGSLSTMPQVHTLAPPSIPRSTSCNALSALAASIFLHTVSDDISNIASHSSHPTLMADAVRHVQLQALTRAPVIAAAICAKDAYGDADPAKAFMTCMSTPPELDDPEPPLTKQKTQLSAARKGRRRKGW